MTRHGVGVGGEEAPSEPSVNSAVLEVCLDVSTVRLECVFSKNLRTAQFSHYLKSLNAQSSEILVTDLTIHNFNNYCQIDIQNVRNSLSKSAELCRKISLLFWINFRFTKKLQR